MCKKLTCLTFFLFVFGLAVRSPVVRGQEGLIGYWKFDESSGTTATDLAGGDNNGTLANAAQWQPGAGRTGGAVLYDSVQNTGHVEFPTTGMSISQGTMMVWANLADPYPTNRNDSSYFFGHTTQPSYNNRIQLYMNTADTNLDLGLGDSHTRQTDMMTLQTGTWYHVALTWDSGNYVVFVNGEEVGSGTYTGLTTLFDIMDIGNDGNPTSGNQEAFAGLLDEARLYNRALGAGEIRSAMAAAPYPLASGPSPKEGSVLSDTWVTLSWRPGDLAVSHDVYLGDNFDDVNNAARDSELYRINQTSTFYVAGFPGYAYPDGLVPGTTYYWRIDEVNDADPNSPWKGPVWSFSIPSKTAYNPDPADGAEAVAVTASLTWTAGFGAKLHTVYFGDDFDTVANATGGAPQGTTTYRPNGVKKAKTYYWRVDEFDGTNTYKGDVWSFTTQGAVGGPNPVNGAVDVKPTTFLTWTAGALAASHEVYFGTDPNAVKNASKTSPEYKGSKALGDESYDPGKLQLETAYYWRIDEVNTANPDSPWKGSVWSFTTGDYYLIDDFEGYTDNDTANEAIWQTWVDGFGIPDNGAQVGYLLPPYAEQTIVHGGTQSMPLLYENTGGVTNSEASLTMTSQRDWTEAGVSEL
jgi:Concanavalin A-like lectin/glucanases superfamily